MTVHSQPNEKKVVARILKMTIRKIQADDNAAIAKIIRDSLLEFGAAKPGTVYFDKSTDHLSEVFTI